MGSEQGVTSLTPATPDTSSKGSSRKAHAAAKAELPLTSTPSWPGESRSPVAPSWLSMSMDAALGCRASIFQIQRTQPTGKRTSIAATTTAVNIHPQASPLVYRSVLDDAYLSLLNLVIIIMSRMHSLELSGGHSYTESKHNICIILYFIFC